MEPTILEKFHPMSSEVAFSTAFLDFDNRQPEVASDVISSVAVQYVGMDVCVNLVMIGQTVLEIYDCLTL